MARRLPNTIGSTNAGPSPQISQDLPQSRLTMRAMRLMEEATPKNEEFEKLKFKYEWIEQQTKMLELYKNVEELAAQIPFKNDPQKIHEDLDELKVGQQKLLRTMESIEEVVQLKVPTRRDQTYVKELEIANATLRKENNELHLNIQHYVHEQSAKSKKAKQQQMKEQPYEECKNRKCKERERQMMEQEKQLKFEQSRNLGMLNPIMAVQYERQHDQLKKEYIRLTTNSNPPAILGQLEKVFYNPFHAKVVLTKILMVSYEECKRVVIHSVAQHIEKLFTVQTKSDEKSGETRDVDMEDLSRAYGILLQATASKSRPATPMQEICGNIKRELKREEQLQNKAAEKTIQKLPLEQVVELTWKFVTQNNPLILCQPETFHEDIQERDFHHWNPKQPKPYTLTYARPVLYQSYDGNIAGRGLVSNTPYQ